MTSFGVLGPLTIAFDGHDRPLPALLQRRLLAALLSRVNRPISPADLVAVLWGEDPPANSHKTLQVHVHRLRRLLGDGRRLCRHPAGYTLCSADDELDAARFTTLAEKARVCATVGERNQASELYAQALRLWRGAAYADVSDCFLISDEATRLDEQRLLCQEEHIAVQLELGQVGPLIPELQGLTRAHPYREILHAQLMLALHQTGRQVEALKVYRDIRTDLAEQVGVEPGARLRQVHAAILRGQESHTAIY